MKIRSRICLSSTFPRTDINIKIYKLQLCLLFCVRVKLGLIFENRVLSRIFGPKKDVVTGDG